MKVVKVILLVASLSIFGLGQTTPQGGTSPWAPPSQTSKAQSPAAPPGAAQTTSTTAASSSQNSISGCMQQSWGRYLIRNNASSATYSVFGGGKDLSGDANHVVTVQGTPDPQEAQGNIIPFYAQNVHNTGQTCGPIAAVQGLPVTGGTGNQGTAMNATTSTQQGVTPGAQTPAAWQAGNAKQNQPSPNAGANPQIPGSSSNMSSPAGQTQNAATGSGTSARPQQPGEEEKKGTALAGTPSAAGSAAATSSGTNATNATAESLAGCLSGSGGQYSLSANGQFYALQGNTAALSGLSGHQVEITGQIGTGNEVQVTSARDLGQQCSQR